MIPQDTLTQVNTHSPESLENNFLNKDSNDNELTVRKTVAHKVENKETLALKERAIEKEIQYQKYLDDYQAQLSFEALSPRNEKDEQMELKELNKNLRRQINGKSINQMRAFCEEFFADVDSKGNLYCSFELQEIEKFLEAKQTGIHNNYEFAYEDTMQILGTASMPFLVGSILDTKDGFNIRESPRTYWAKKNDGKETESFYQDSQGKMQSATKLGIKESYGMIAINCAGGVPENFNGTYMIKSKPIPELIGSKFVPATITFTKEEKALSETELEEKHISTGKRRSAKSLKGNNDGSFKSSGKPKIETNKIVKADNYSAVAI